MAGAPRDGDPRDGDKGMTDTLTPVLADKKELGWKKLLPKPAVAALTEGAQLQ
jgi:hypothetical protein